MNLPTLPKLKVDETLSFTLSRQARCSPWEALSNCEILSAMSNGRLLVVEGTVDYNGERKLHAWLVDSAGGRSKVIDPTYATSPWKAFPQQYTPTAQPRAVVQLADFKHTSVQSLVYRLTGALSPLVDF